MAFAASGNVIPATGDITFNSNASSNAVRQVFGEATSNMQGLAGSNYNTSARPPPFTVTTANQVPTAASGNLKLSFFAGKSLFLTTPSQPAIATLTTTSVTPTLTGGSGTSYYISIGTSAGASNTVGWQLATSATAITGLTFALDTNYYISVYGCNSTKGTSSLASSNTTAFIIPNAPTFSTNVISNTTFTAVASSTTAGAVISYQITPSTGTTQSSAGVFTGLTSNTQYYVTATATMGTYSSNSRSGTSVWCLAPPTLSAFTSTPTTATVTIGGISVNATGVVISNVDTGSASASLATSTTSASFTRAATSASNTFQSNTLVSYYVKAIGASTSYTSSKLSFIVVDGGLGASKTITLTAATFSYIACGGRGGSGVNTANQGYSPYGYAGYGTGTSTLTVGAELDLFPGMDGYDGSYSYYTAPTYSTPSASCGDRSRGGNGGTGRADAGSYGGNGGCGGGGGAASQILCRATNYMIVAPGGAGSGGGGGQGGNGGWGGSSGTGSPGGGQGQSYAGNMYDGGNGGGYYGGYGGASGAGGQSGSSLVGNYSQGTAGAALSATITNNGSSSGNGGNGSAYFGAVAGGGGGGYGGGGGGVARNYNGSIDSGGGGGGGAYSSDGSATWQGINTPMIAISWYS